MTVHHTIVEGPKTRFNSLPGFLRNHNLKSKAQKSVADAWPRVENCSSSWDSQSGATSASWPEEMEEVATNKVLNHWSAMQRTLYDEHNQVKSQSLLEECMQWRTQLPHLRVVGKALGPSFDNEKDTDAFSQNVKRNRIVTEGEEEEVIEEHRVTKDEQNSSPRRQHREKIRRDALSLILGFMCAEVLSDEKDEELLSKDLDAILKVTPAPTYSDRNLLRNEKVTGEYNEVVGSKQVQNVPENEKVVENENFENGSQNWPEAKKNSMSKDGVEQMSLRGSMMPISARRQKDPNDVEYGLAIDRDRLYTPQLGRNKLGTVFNEKIIVTPVPFVTTTRESFSTLKTTPMRYMGKSFDASSLQRTARNLSSNSARRAGLLRVPYVQSAWQAVCPTIWPKNTRLAPIDTSRLPGSQNRSLTASPAQPQRSRNSLSPLSRHILPVSPSADQDNDSTFLGIQGRKIIGQSSRLGLLKAGWDSSPRSSKKIRKKVRNTNDR